MANRQPAGGDTAPVTPSLPDLEDEEKVNHAHLITWRISTAQFDSVTVVVTSRTVTQHRLSFQ